MKGIGGIACAINLPDASELVHACLELQEGLGIDCIKIVSEEGGTFFEVDKLIAEGLSFHGLNFNEELPGKFAIGYNTDFQNISQISSGSIQPYVASRTRFGTIAIVQCGSPNGNGILKERLDAQRGASHSKTNAEMILHQITRSIAMDQKNQTIEKSIISALQEIDITQPLVILTGDGLFAISDPYGFHPLSLGRLDGGFLICSENSTFAHLEAEHKREIKPGEILKFSRHDPEPESFFYADKERYLCICRCIYIGNPRSTYGDQKILHETFRELLGMQFFLENEDMAGDFLLPILNSGKNQTGGLEKKSKIPLKEYLLRSSEHSRTKKNLPYPKSLLYENVRKNSFRKYHLREDKVAGRHAIVVDCIMRSGVGARIINERLIEAKAKKISNYFAAPPVVRTCPYDKMLHPGQNHLLMANYSLEQARKDLLSNDLRFLSIEGLMQVVKETYDCNVCTGCLLGGSCPK
jgi:amidophosphoribosyltransferase